MAVLVVDDEEIVRFVAVALFEDMGFEVLEAESGPSALAILAERPEIALLFTDCRMPGMSGTELARAAVARCPRLKVVLVSGYVDCLEPGAWTLLSKPYDFVHVRRVVDGILGTSIDRPP